MPEGPQFELRDRRPRKRDWVLGEGHRATSPPARGLVIRGLGQSPDRKRKRRPTIYYSTAVVNKHECKMCRSTYLFTYVQTPGVCTSWQSQCLTAEPLLAQCSQAVCQSPSRIGLREANKGKSHALTISINTGVSCSGTKCDLF